MKIIKHLRIAILPALCLWVLSSCLRDSNALCPPGTGDEFRSTRLAIRLPKMHNGMKTRAEVGDYDEISNFWIFIAQGDDIKHSLYIAIPFDESDNPLEPVGDAGVTVSMDGIGGSVIYAAEWLKGKGFASNASNFIVVANYGNGADIQSVETVTQLRQLKDSGSGGLNPLRPIMFGESLVNSDTDKEVELRRTTAMVTLEINGADLHGNIEITPLSVSLHNVPAYCLIGETNILTEDDGITRKANAVLDNGDSRNIPTWGVIERGGESVGGHYPETSPGVYNYGAENVEPLFMYENYHGGDGFGFPETNQIYKRPAVCVSTDKIAIEASTKACSYLRVRAGYSNGTQSGTVTYRVFLGDGEKAATQNFDVIRNHYYRVTLNLSGSGISEDEISWRLDTDLSTGGGSQLTESDFTFNGDGEKVITYEITTTGQEESTFLIEYDTNGDGNADNGNGWSNAGGSPFVYIIDVKNDVWEALPLNSGTTFGDVGKENGDKNNGRRQFNLYIAPMIPGVTWNSAGIMRQVKLRFQQTTSGDRITTEWITITQYTPIVIPLSRYASDTEISNKIRDLGWSTSGTLYLDRIDSQEAPWGFETVQIDQNGTSGINNGTRLMQGTYATTASTYLPYGNGSAMMDAAFSKYYQRDAPGGLAAMLPTPGTATINPTYPTVAQILAYTTPNGYPDNIFIPSVAEWDLLDMLHMADGNLFEGEDYQVGLWNRYWTSDADTEAGSRNSYTYIMGEREDINIRTESRYRGTPTLYRKMYYIP